MISQSTYECVIVNARIAFEALCYTPPHSQLPMLDVSARHVISSINLSSAQLRAVSGRNNGLRFP